jgi:hypothetical protein
MNVTAVTLATGEVISIAVPGGALTPDLLAPLAVRDAGATDLAPTPSAATLSAQGSAAAATNASGSASSALRA